MLILVGQIWRKIGTGQLVRVVLHSVSTDEVSVVTLSEPESAAIIWNRRQFERDHVLVMHPQPTFKPGDLISHHGARGVRPGQVTAYGYRRGERSKYPEFWYVPVRLQIDPNTPLEPGQKPRYGKVVIVNALYLTARVEEAKPYTGPMCLQCNLYPATLRVSRDDLTPPKFCCYHCAHKYALARAASTTWCATCRVWNQMPHAVHTEPVHVDR